MHVYSVVLILSRLNLVCLNLVRTHYYIQSSHHIYSSQGVLTPTPPASTFTKFLFQIYHYMYYLVTYILYTLI